jgi:hypothetical protein
MDELPPMPLPSSPPPRPYLTPLAVLIGFGLCAAALSRAGEPRPGAQPLSAPPPQQQFVRSAPLPFTRPPTSHGLRDLFRPYQQAAVTRCGLDPALADDPTVALAELPLSLSVASDGRVIEAVPTGSARIFGLDGAMRRLEFGEGRARCYAALVRDWVRFSPVDAPSRLEAPLRVVDLQ